MSRVLSELLGASEPAFSLMIKRLERLGGGNGTDIRLTTDILAKVRFKTRELGLDPTDSSGEELYHGLMHLAKIHDTHLCKALGASEEADTSDLIFRIKETPQKLGLNLGCWAIKHSVAKRLLAKKPPKNLMRQLGYRSIDSLLKRENMAEIYAALRFAEDEQWFRRFASLLEDLKPTDFENRGIEIINLNADRWGFLADDFIEQNGLNLSVSPEMGAILILPLPAEKLPGLTLVMLPLLFEAINEVRMYSALFKLRQVRPKFGALVSASVAKGLGSAVKLAGKPVDWRSIQKHLVNSNENLPEVFEPHLIAEDLNWRKAEDVLIQLEPSLNFWRGLEYVGAKVGHQIISFNLLDVAVSYVNRLEYGNHSTVHFKQALWHEIFTRYLGEKNVQNEVFSQLEQDMASKPKRQRVLA